MEPINDNEGTPLLHQIVAVYRDKYKASLVNAYGDYIGLHSLDYISYISEGPLFSKLNYDIGDIIIWIDGEDVYEGEIKSLYDPYASVVNVKKLMPINHVSNVSYWKISEGRKSEKDSTSLYQGIIGNDLNKGRD